VNSHGFLGIDHKKKNMGKLPVQRVKIDPLFRNR